MKFLNPMLVLILILCGTACKEKDDDKEDPKISISGITERDGNGNLTGNVDPADWNMNTSFNSMENALFPSDKLPICMDRDTAYKIVLYPNPNDGIFVFGTIIPKERTSIRIVDEYLNVLYKNDSITKNSLTIREDQNTSKRKVRLYYRVYNDSCKYQGYGDIVIN